MPRGPRLDAPGVLHHVMIRGIERRTLFIDDDDRLDFLSRLERVLVRSDTACLGFALMGNHVHLLVRSGTTPLSRIMASLGTGYARRFNERHGRVGHLFQNRFRSDRIECDAHRLALVRYVHRNPLDAGLVGSLDELEQYPWTGYPALLGHAPSRLLATSEVLAWFGATPEDARRELRRWMAAAAPGPVAGHPPEMAVDDVLLWVCSRLGVDPRRVRGGSRTRVAARARALCIHLCRARLGLGAIEIATALGLDEAVVRRGFERGREEADRWGLEA